LERKGVSTYISVLLLIVVVIAGGILIYGYTMGWFGRLGGEGEVGILSLDESSADGSTNVITAYVRNVGGSSVTIDAVYVEGALLPNANTTVAGNDLDTPTAIAQNSVVEVLITKGGLDPGVTYEVRIVGIDNTQLAFSVKAD
jgi:hypothetical protein